LQSAAFGRCRQDDPLGRRPYGAVHPESQPIADVVDAIRLGISSQLSFEHRISAPATKMVVSILMSATGPEWRAIRAADMFCSGQWQKWVLIASVSRRRNCALCGSAPLAGHGVTRMTPMAAERRFARNRVRTPTLDLLSGFGESFDSPFEVLRRKTRVMLRDKVGRRSARLSGKRQMD